MKMTRFQYDLYGVRKCGRNNEVVVLTLLTPRRDKYVNSP